MEKLYQFDARIVSSEQVSDETFKLVFAGKDISESARPGQFVMIKIDEERTFLRRPFSICEVDKNKFSVVFKVVGTGTKILAQKRPNEILNIIGPCGNGYPAILFPASVIFLAGGVGVASLLFLAQKLKNLSGSSFAFIGAKTEKEVLLKDNFEKLGYRVIVSTEDGSFGSKGLISDVFYSYLKSGLQKTKTLVYACGPKPMLKKVAEICQKKNIKCYVSLEEHLACGVGACMGCVVKVRDLQTGKLKYKRVCKDGPVFSAEEIVWEK